MGNSVVVKQMISLVKKIALQARMFRYCLITRIAIGLLKFTLLNPGVIMTVPFDAAATDTRVEAFWQLSASF